ncbi:MAG TPA: 50S ribosomal L9 C-terminal domain-containing protein, partial [Chthoniobacteraceae bacterium]|nr:50S ribosomal L9 C-terminal domain-containing protein [Chthoniobacteraceae bacterium]
TASDLADKLKSELGGKIEIDRHRIQLDKPIKETGPIEIPIRLHSDVVAKLHLNVRAKGSDEGKAEEEKADEKGFRAKPKAKHAK